MEWQPIETAPKDGTVILANAGKRVVMCQWEKWPDGRAGWYAFPHNAILKKELLTHWMPLPAPPAR